MKTTKPIAIGCDHGGVELKDAVVRHLEEKGYTVNDCGTYNKDSVHYPVYADKVCKEIQSGNSELGILICSTGLGMSIAANKHKGCRASLCADTYSARLTRMHNNSNILCIGALVTGSALAMDIVDQYIESEFEGGRHATRVDMFTALEEDWKN